MFFFCAFCQLCDTQEGVSQALSGGVTGAGMTPALPPACAEVPVFRVVLFLQTETWMSWSRN